MFIFIPSMDQGETSGLSNGVWAVSAHAVPVLSPALTACGAVPGASPRCCVCTSRAATPPTAAATGSACPGAAAATAPSGPAPPATAWTAAPPTAACTASAAPVSPRGILECACLVGGAASPLLQPLLVRTRVLQEPAEGMGHGSGLETSTTSTSVLQFPFLPQSCALSFL